MSLVDMHIHSYYSDGTKSPGEILEEAKKKDIRILAVTDHDVLEGSRELLQLADNAERDIRVIPGVELTAEQDGHTYHILGYGVDLDQERFRKFVKENRTHLDGMNDELILRMEKDYPEISVADYEAYPCDRSMGGWKALHYLKERRLAESLTDALKYYGMYQVTYEQAGFATAGQVCDAIHQAGGKAILAHPGKAIEAADAEDFEAKLRELLTLDLDGVECWYPTHTEVIRDICLKVCKEQGLLITCGSDSHGDFEVEDVPMGILPVIEEMVKLDEI